MLKLIMKFLNLKMRLLLLLCGIILDASATTPEQILRDMFTEMVEKKNAEVISEYYHPDFMLYSNGQTQNYKELIEFHEKAYKTEIQYHVRIDDETVVSSANRIAARVLITITKPNEPQSDIEVIMIVETRDNKIYRAWETTHPDWTQDKKLPQS